MRLERCQLGSISNANEFRIVNGCHAEGIHCYYAGDRRMRRYYTQNGENVFQFSIKDKYLIKCKVKDYWGIKHFIHHSKYKAFEFIHKGIGIPTSKEIVIIDPEIITNIEQII